ncbi:phosphate uptake regulator PhoU [Paucilactobacillus oligofermentans DSM 15707 = LMG 22743]|uniref:Phosphate-specific transport system accessory protein PhoU n=1 Tax=Paucilactobacillus oligofermentans DSM 15707 = LMG 22743 TaxID=1423778 RepID=A0A0R1RGR8_9LACO|nr:phosphate signaling complex protein PhoU [Paucilactobacillus oligofermentans]KRL56071.1 phosphate uptake regulator PhoU [Paucilactobacillus oligofermentans DSM 15707 = LMG 22743]CUS25944.1 Phosphate transport system protein PhoU [Paucilactobacillus oligofermentans DSM 15707 = LMG 22743]
MHELFADELKKLRGRFMEMGINVSEQIYASTKSFIDHDLKAANKVIEDDITTNKEEVSLEERALKLIALQQPVASDFRAIISILKASTDLERMGDYSVNIARETIRVKGNPRVNEIEKAIDEMTKLIREMLEEALDAYVRNDEKMARKVALRDLEADKQYILIRNNITAAMQQDSETVVANSGYMMVVRLLERMGDHIVNLSEWIVYNASGELVELNPGKKDPEMVQKLLNDKL